MRWSRSSRAGFPPPFPLAPGLDQRKLSKGSLCLEDVLARDQLLMGVSFGGKSARAAQALYTRMGFTHDGGLFTKNRRQQCLEP